MLNNIVEEKNVEKTKTDKIKHFVIKYNYYFRHEIKSECVLHHDVNNGNHIYYRCTYAQYFSLRSFIMCSIFTVLLYWRKRGKIVHKR